LIFFISTSFVFLFVYLWEIQIITLCFSENQSTGAKNDVQLDRCAENQPEQKRGRKAVEAKILTSEWKFSIWITKGNAILFLFAAIFHNVFVAEMLAGM